MGRIVVTSAELQKSFRRFRDIALREPVVVTSHGRESLVLLSAEEYERLKRRDREALYAWELSDADLKAIAEAEPPPEAAQYDDELSS
jgi:PHD/YefM family antitoxin component YafN of YafNO toxin-antitoxin module